MVVSGSRDGNILVWDTRCSTKGMLATDTVYEVLLATTVHWVMYEVLLATTVHWVMYEVLLATTVHWVMYEVLLATTVHWVILYRIIPQTSQLHI